ncbi:MAG: hypothetical protein K0Q63_447, partial [Paenibacillus sp.]|nr:hypothetical protein [Paenibacillus sp.]
MGRGTESRGALRSGIGAALTAALLLGGCSDAGVGEAGQ